LNNNIKTITTNNERWDVHNASPTIFFPGFAWSRRIPRLPGKKQCKKLWRIYRQIWDPGATGGMPRWSQAIRDEKIADAHREFEEDLEKAAFGFSTCSLTVGN